MTLYPNISGCIDKKQKDTYPTKIYNVQEVEMDQQKITIKMDQDEKNEKQRTSKEILSNTKFLNLFNTNKSRINQIYLSTSEAFCLATTASSNQNQKLIDK